MRIKFLKLVGAVVLTVTAATPILAQDDQDEYPRMHLRVAHAFPASWAQGQADQWFADEVHRRSDGNIRVTIMWAGAGGAPTEILKLVGTGALDMGITPTSYYSEQLPLTSAGNTLPMTFDTNRAASRYIEGLVRNVPAVQEELKRNNVRPLFFHTINSYMPLCTKPVRTIEDFEGLRIRSYGPYQPILWESLGAVGVNVMPAELYEGLQKGRLDCAFYSPHLYVNGGLYEVAQNLTSYGFGPQVAQALWVNDEKWENEYPENVKELLTEVAEETRERSLQGLERARTESLVTMKDAGVQVIEFQNPEEIEKRAPDFRAIWLERMEEQGLGEEAQVVYDYWMEHGDR